MTWLASIQAVLPFGPDREADVEPRPLLLDHRERQGHALVGRVGQVNIGESESGWANRSTEGPRLGGQEAGLGLADPADGLGRQVGRADVGRGRRQRGASVVVSSASSPEKATTPNATPQATRASASSTGSETGLHEAQGYGTIPPV